MIDSIRESFGFSVGRSHTTSFDSSGQENPVNSSTHVQLDDDSLPFSPHDIDTKSLWVHEKMKERRIEYTEKKSLKVFTGTWNVNNKYLDDVTPSDSLDKWLLPSGEPFPDVYAVGMQEIVDLNTKNVVLSKYESIEKAAYWIDKITQCLATTNINYSLIGSKHLVGLLLVVFVREDLLPQVTDVRVCSLGIGILGIMGNKGGISIRMQYCETSIIFVCVHLRAQQNACDGRNVDAKNILDKTVLPPNGSLCPSIQDGGHFKQWKLVQHQKEQNIGDHDIIFWFGDLNYRIDYKNTCKLNEIYDICNTDEWNKLLVIDQLNSSRAKKSVALEAFEEGTLSFPPTYKYQPGTSIYEQRPDKKHRAPAWCDRVLWKSNIGKECVKQLYYKRAADLLSSDHKPVYAAFDCSIDVCKDDEERIVYKDLLNTIDKWENYNAPKVSIEGSIIEIPQISINCPMSHTVTAKNIGKGLCSWEFVPKVEDDVISACAWLSIKPLRGVLGPGEEQAIIFTVDINTANLDTIFPSNESDRDSDAISRPSSMVNGLQDIVILRVTNGSDYFCMINIDSVDGIAYERAGSSFDGGSGVDYGIYARQSEVI